VSGFWNRLMLVLMMMTGASLALGAQTHRKARAADPPRVTPAEIAQQKTFGVKTAPIRIDEFTDFECPACRALYMETLRPLIDDYVSSGKVYLVHHDFPLPMHPYSHKAAYYADAAAAIGRFEQVEEVLFVNQPQWAANGKITPFLAKALSPTQLKQVEELARTKEVQEAVQRDVEMGRQLNVRQTPTMFVTHKGRRTPLVGVTSYPVLRRYLDALLKQ
jgi:protein-disulfide isomerase